MIMWWRWLSLVLIGFGTGTIIAGGVFAFIAVIGIIPRMANKSKTAKYIPIYEDCIAAGGAFGTLHMVFPFTIPLGSVITSAVGLLIGIFIGVLAVCLAEITDVIPIMTDRVNIKQGVLVLLLSVATGKMIGSLVHWLIPNFVP